jgi:hypothetical protein
MAACTAAVTTNNSSAVGDRVASKTTMKGLIDGTAPITLGKGLKAAFVKVTFDGGDYASGGVSVSMLSALPGWTAVLQGVPAVFLDNATYHFAQYNPSTDKVLVHVMTTGAEHAAAAMTNGANATMLVLGY